MAYDDTGPILITGGTGFIGSYLAMRLLEKKGNENEQVLLFDCNPDTRRLTGFNKGPSDRKDPKYDPNDRYNRLKNRITFVQGDLSSLELVLALFEHQPKSVFHLGALLSAGADANPTFGFQVDTLGTRNVLEAARIYCQRKNSPPVKVIFPSTIASFGFFPPPRQPGDKVSNEDVQMPNAYVGPDTRLDILYVEDAVSALIKLHDAPAEKLKRRVYNIAGIRIGDKAPQASDIKAAVIGVKPEAETMLTFEVNQQLSDIVHTFGILDDSVAREDWGWTGESFGLQKAVDAFFDDVKNYPGRIKAIELY